MSCVGQQGIQSTPCIPHLAENIRLGIVVANIELVEDCLLAEFSCYGLAIFACNVAARNMPSFGDEIRCESFSNAGLRSSLTINTLIWHQEEH